MIHMVQNKTFGRKWRFFFAGLASAVFFLSVTDLVRAQNETLPEEALVNLVKPSIVRLGEHVSGVARIPEVKVDIKRRLVATVPNTFTEVPINEYLTGSGFVIHSDGYIATNAHVVSQETVKQMLASESALSAMFENALFLSDEEMQKFLQSNEGERFGREVLRYVIEHSTFDIQSKISVFRPDSEKTRIPELVEEGFSAEVVFVNDNFLDDERDVAIVKIAETGLPAMRLGDAAELVVGKRTYVFGFPATAEVNSGNPTEATFTQGVVSAIKQFSNQDLKMFQTDAKVSEGSSGGPLFNERGEAVGIVTFQTGELERVAGDNFAFALPVDVVREAASEAHIIPEEGTYGRFFREGFSAFSLKRCDRAAQLFSEAVPRVTPFVSLSYVETYIKRCQELQAAGLSLDTRFDELRGEVRSLGNPFFYLLGGGLFLFGMLGTALFWLLRQVRREEREINALEHRLLHDELRIRSYQHTDRDPNEVARMHIGMKRDPNTSFQERKKRI